MIFTVGKRDWNNNSVEGACMKFSLTFGTFGSSLMGNNVVKSVCIKKVEMQNQVSPNH
jgi:hypothetical protein